MNWYLWGAYLVTFALLAYQRHVIARTGSIAIGADHVHYQSDLLLNGAVIVALVLDQYLGLAGADPLFGIAIALWLAFGAWRASAAAIDQLMDKLDRQVVRYKDRVQDHHHASPKRSDFGADLM